MAREVTQETHRQSIFTSPADSCGIRWLRPSLRGCLGYLLCSTPNNRNHVADGAASEPRDPGITADGWRFDPDGCDGVAAIVHRAAGAAGRGAGSGCLAAGPVDIVSREVGFTAGGVVRVAGVVGNGAGRVGLVADRMRFVADGVCFTAGTMGFAAGRACFGAASVAFAAAWM